ncbi:MAG: cytochrome ubiquinol oxidase subunit I [Chloroflexota bacterium]|nr:cytochrome ubiquinol oxidase subunit I [Chloroflexota bacterium]
MLALGLARWQFAIVTIYHFFFVPVTLGLSILLAILETKYVTSGDETYKRMVKFWGKLFLINFAIGVVTGIVQEFQFGLNWSEYSRFMGDIFGAPLAIEALLAFYLESTFIGIWVFGWDKLSKKAHAVALWLVAIGSNVSALWILIANSFMQNPVGYALRNGRAEMTDFWALVGNANVWFQFPHVLSSGIATAGFLLMAFSAYHLLKGENTNRDFFRLSFKWAATYALIGAVLVGVIGHFQGQFLVEHQPLKMAAAEALWETEQPAGFSLVAGIDQDGRRNTFDLKVPGALSFLSYNNFTSKVEGINDLQATAEAEYGAGNYIPPVALNFWSFRIMVGFGSLMVLFALLGVFWSRKDQLEKYPWFLKAMIPTGFMPTLANTFGWLMAETGRWPWIVYGLQKIEDAASPNVTAGNVWFSMISLTLLYGILMVIGAKLALEHGKAGPAAIEAEASAY